MRHRLVHVASLLSVLLSSQMCGRASADSLDGRWEGYAAFGERRMELALEFSSSSDGHTARITVPAERVLSKRLRQIEINLPNVRFSIPFGDQQAEFRGTVREGTLTGTASTEAGPLQIVLNRKGPINQPPYREEEMSFANSDVRLAGSLLIPAGAGPHPSIVLIHGSSTPDRDDFRFYADRFARHGVAAFIYDKRSTGGQPGGMSQVDLRDLAGDAVAAITALRARSDIDARRIGVWGHSQGGWVAPMAASQAESVAFVVGFSAPGVTYAVLDKYANATRLRSLGFDQADIDDAMAALTRVDEFVRKGGDSTALQRFLDDAHRTRWAARTTLPRRAPTVDDARSWLRWRNLDLDPADYWSKVRVPVLLLYGQRDEVVPVEQSVKRIGDALATAGNTDVTIRVFDRENHNISTSQEFLDLMVDWVRRQKR